MAVSAKASGTDIPNTGDSTLATITDAGVYELTLDLSQLVGSSIPDILRVREIRKTLSGSTARTEWEEFFVGGMCPSMATFRPKMTTISLAYTISMIQGSTARSVPWSINQVA